MSTQWSIKSAEMCFRLFYPPGVADGVSKSMNGIRDFVSVESVSAL